MASTRSHQERDGREHDATERVPSFRPRGNEVRLRMYGQGLGDCFLLTFPRTRSTSAVPADAGRPVYVLIDCGVITGTPNSSQRMKRIVRDIRLTTRDDSLPPTADGPRGHLDLLILTHEHWDHLSGFIDAQNEWKQIQVDQLWMSWMEKDNPEGLAGVLQKLKDKQRRALVEVVKRAALAPREDRLRMAAEIASFLSEARFNGQEFAAGRSLADGLKFAKSLVANKDDRTFCEPGEVHAVPGTNAVAYVLGPPQDWEWLNTMNPSTKTPETFVGADEHGFAEMRSLFTLGRMLDHRSPFNAFVMPLLGPGAGGHGRDGRRRGDAGGAGPLRSVVPVRPHGTGTDPDCGSGVEQRDRCLSRLQFLLQRDQSVAADRLRLAGGGGLVCSPGGQFHQQHQPGDCH